MKIEKTYDSMSLIKGIGALIVCSSHILDCFVWGNGNKPILWEGMFSKPILWYFFWSGGFQVSMFCLISGFFAWKKEIISLKQLMTVFIKRYLNFVTLIFASDFIMYLLKIFKLMPLKQSGIALANSDMPYTHEVTIGGLILNSLKLDTSINGALWMIKYLFIGNCVIYLLKYLQKHIKNWGYVVYVACLITTLIMDSCVFVTVCGVILFEIIRKLPDAKNETKYELVACLILLIFTYLAQNPFGFTNKVHDLYTVAVCIAICVCTVFVTNKLVKNDFLVCKYIKNESIAVYCVHIPVIYSVGLYVYILLNKYIRNINILTSVVCVISMVSVLLIAWLYQHFVERNRVKFVSRLF